MIEKKITKITFLLDKKNNWFEPYLNNFDMRSPTHIFKFRISHDPEDIKEQDIVFIIGYTQILSNLFLSCNVLNLVVHESNLPVGKGFAPVQWQILEGAHYIPMCLLEATNQVDSGDIVHRFGFELTGLELYDEIRSKQGKATIELIVRFLSIYPNFSREKQTGQETFYKRRGPIDGELDIDQTIREQFNLLRVGNNEQWPSYFIYEGKKYLVKIFRDKVQ